jgi:hypothetical protein
MAKDQSVALHGVMVGHTPVSDIFTLEPLAFLKRECTERAKIRRSNLQDT